MDKDIPRTITLINGGGESIDAISTDRVEPFISQTLYTYQLNNNEDQLPWEWGEILPDTILEIVKKAEVTSILKQLKIPEHIINNPNELYVFMSHLQTAKKMTTKIPVIPIYQLELSAADNGLYSRLKEFQDSAMKLEDFYEDACKYIVNAVSTKS